MEDHGEPPHESIVQIRGRIHKLADMVQTHEGLLIEHRTLLPLLTKQLEALRGEAATREGVTVAINTLKLQMELKLEKIQETLDPIKRGVYWAVVLILGSVVVAVLALVLRNP